MGIPAPSRALGQWVLPAPKPSALHVQVSWERAELFAHKHPGTKPPPEGKGEGGGNRIKTGRT